MPDAGWEKPEVEEDDGVISVVAYHTDKRRAITFRIHLDHVLISETALGEGSSHTRLYLAGKEPI